MQQTVSDRLVHSLPLVGRNFLPLASLAAGFTGNANFPSPQGQIYWTNNVLVDGASHFSKWRSAPRTFYSGYGLEAIKEVRVLTSRFSAEYGDALATVTTALTNSGDDEFHGSALFFVQNSALNEPPEFASGQSAVEHASGSGSRSAARSPEQGSHPLSRELRGPPLARQQHRRLAGRPSGEACPTTRTSIWSSSESITGRRRTI